MERKRTFFLALSSYFIGYLYVCCMLFGFTDFDSAVEWYALLFAAVFALWGNEIGKEKKPLGKDRLLFLAAMLLIALAISLGRCNATGGWEIFALHGAAALWGLYRMGGDLGLEEPLFLIRDTISALLLLPFGSFFLRIRTVFRGLVSCFRSISRPADKKRRQSTLIVVLCLLAALPVLIWTAKLLTQADENFGAFLSGIGSIFQWTLPDSAVTQLIRVLLSLPVSAYLYGLLAGSAHRGTPDAAAAKGKIAGMQRLPAAAACGVWGMFAALYVLFFLVQANNLLAVFRGEVPGTLTAANYARSGFFQLCLVMGINFLLLELGKPRRHLAGRDPDGAKSAPGGDRRSKARDVHPSVRLHSPAAAVSLGRARPERRVCAHAARPGGEKARLPQLGLFHRAHLYGAVLLLNRSSAAGQHVLPVSSELP